MAKERVAIITASVANFDNVAPVPQQTMPFDYFCVTKVYPPNFELLSNRMLSKYPKVQGHKLFDNQILIWIDGRVKITSNKFVQYMVEKLESSEIVGVKHPERNDSYQELSFILRQMDGGDEYLLSRYDRKKIKGELDFITKEELPRDYPLRNAGIYARWNNKKINDAFDEWWKLIIDNNQEYDQVLYNYICWKRELNVNEVVWDDNYFTVGSHKGE